MTGQKDEPGKMSSGLRIQQKKNPITKFEAFDHTIITRERLTADKW